MIRYFVFDTEEEPLKISAAWLDLHRPKAVRNPRDITTGVFPVRKHVTKDQWVLEIDTDYEIVVTPAGRAAVRDISDTIGVRRGLETALIAASKVPAQVIPKFETEVAKTKLAGLVLAEELLSGLEKSETEMRAEGWFPVE